MWVAVSCVRTDTAGCSAVQLRATHACMLAEPPSRSGSIGLAEAARGQLAGCTNLLVGLAALDPHGTLELTSRRWRSIA